MAAMLNRSRSWSLFFRRPDLFRCNESSGIEHYFVAGCLRLRVFCLKSYFVRSRKRSGLTLISRIFQHRNVGQVTVAFSEIQAIANHKFVRDLKTQIINRNFLLSAFVLIEQRSQLYALGAS